MFTFSPQVVMIALVFIVLDYASGFIKAAMQHDIQSSKMREGLYHKGSFVLAIVLAILCEYAIFFIPELGFTVPLVLFVCAYIIMTELVSILENLGHLNPALKSSKLLSYFNVAKNTSNGGLEMTPSSDTDENK